MLVLLRCLVGFTVYLQLYVNVQFASSIVSDIRLTFMTSYCKFKIHISDIELSLTRYIIGLFQSLCVLKITTPTGKNSLRFKMKKSCQVKLSKVIHQVDKFIRAILSLKNCKSFYRPISSCTMNIQFMILRALGAYSKLSLGESRIK